MTFLVQPTPRTVRPEPAIVPRDIIRSAATHQHLMQASERPVAVLSFEHCHQDAASHHQLLTSFTVSAISVCVSVCVFVCVC